MNSYRIAVFPLFFLAILFAQIPASAQESYTVAFAHRPPHLIFDKDTSTISGALYDFLNEEIAPAMGVTFVWDHEATNIPRTIQFLESEERDIAALIAFTTERAKTLNFSESHFYASKPSIALLKENPLNKVTGVEDILNLTIGYADNTHITPFMRDPRIRFEFITAVESARLNLRKMANNRIDAVYTPSKAGLLMEIKAEGLEEVTKVIELPEPSSNNHVAFSKKHTELTKKYNEAFVKVGGHKKYVEKLSGYIDVSRL